MKTFILILSIAFFASCSTVYKTGQTPDDLYYSKPKVVVEKTTRYEKRVENYDDRQIRMAIRDPRWRNLDYGYDYDYRYNPYNYGYSYGYYFNPCFYPFPVYSGGINFVNPKNTTIRKANLGGYNNTIVNYQPSKSYTPTQTYQSRRYNNSNYESPRYNTRSTDNDSRNYTPLSSGSSGSSSGSSAPSGTPVSRPGGGG